MACSGCAYEIPDTQLAWRVSGDLATSNVATVRESGSKNSVA
jgi:hypothetical protein